ncbi:dihydroorotate dehydrogenase (fumarate) [Thermanaeromonas toyohensis ToBE]|uniref:dihydrouracil dehydrogenase (NAD(+)) n=1 Tax=Thermanaeromonas toyohensis ToBE TaxID=698762 RepID=A0A1W1VF31_9FIRM|nr:4Fe-4S binding protein [Thermanaeromonas toyohensis]SMB91999.1 dihydroorotate dehydrogenase (fumarate) [Thermanaeromonas toyohensis ToBE]
MANIKVSLCGKELKNPFILGSGPLSYSGEALVRAFKAGAGAATTKTLRLKPADNPYPHMVMSAPGTLINAEKWADLTAEQWITQEIPYAKSKGVVVIASVGHTPEEARALVEGVEEAGADFIELVSYTEDTMVPMIEETKKRTSVPVLAKLSPNWPDIVSAAGRCLEAGADALTVADSFGPVLRLDIRTAHPLLGSPRGWGWLTGAALKPITLRCVAEIALAFRPTVVGLGGVMDASDALEMLLAGASAVGICTAAILKGLKVFQELNQGLNTLLDELGYPTVSSASGRALPYLREEEDQDKLKFSYDPEKCNLCLLCVTRCPYQARNLTPDKVMSLDETKCRYCGFCVSLCRRRALTSDRLSGPAY